MATRFQTKSMSGRGSRGAGIVEAAAGLLVLTTCATLGLLLLINCGIAVYHKEKVSVAAQECSKYATRRLRWNYGFPYSSPKEIEAECKEMSKKLLEKMGIGEATNLQLTQTQGGVTVSIEVKNLQLIKHGAIFPQSISFSEKASSILSDFQPPAILRVISAADKTQQVLIPIYGKVIQPFTSQRGAANGGALPAGTAILRNFDRNYGSFDFVLSSSSFGQTLDGHAHR